MVILGLFRETFVCATGIFKAVFFANFRGFFRFRCGAWKVVLKENCWRGQMQDKFRVKSPVKSFRDLEVYQVSVQLAHEISCFDLEEKKRISEIAESVPRLIAESYGDRFDSKELSHQKITMAITLIVDLIAEIDLLREKYPDKRDVLDKLLSKYLTQKRKVLNLRGAWSKAFGGSNTQRYEERGISSQEKH